MLPWIDDDTLTELLESSDACFKSFRDHDDETFCNLIAEASSLGRLGYLLEHWVVLWHQGRPTRPVCCDHADHPRDEDIPPSAATVLQMLNAPNQDTLTRLIEKVIAWRATGDGLHRQIDISAALMVALHRYLPAGVLPSHYLLAEGSIDRAADHVGCPDLAPLLTRVTTEMWHDRRSAATIFDENALGIHQVRRAAAVLARALAQHLPPGKPFTVIGGHPGKKPEYVITSADDPAKYTDREQRLTAVGTRIVGLVAAGQYNRIETALRKSRNLQDEAETNDLVLTLASWLNQRIKELPAYRAPTENDPIQDALNHL